MSNQFKIKKGKFIALIVLVAMVFGLRYAHNNGLLGPAGAGSASVPQVAALPEAEATTAAMSQISQAALPSQTAVSVPGPEIRSLVMAWNSQMGEVFANGGPTPTTGSLMAQRGVNLHIIREDDVGKMQTQLVAFAKALRDGNAQPTDGAQFMSVMGDGSAATIAGILSMMDEVKPKLGPEYMPEVIGSAGYSRGEDKLMGPPAWKETPKLAKGSLISGYLRDGDWNIALKWASDNGIKNNPDEKTWDADAINWYAANDFIEAGAKYIEGVCEDRPVVSLGKRTGGAMHVCINGVVTWTPGDVNVARDKGGLVSIVSTKEYRSQMPNTIIGIRKWDQDNRKLVEEMLAAMYEGGDQVKAYPAALTRAAAASALVYKEKDGAYWEKYYKGTIETDKQGLQVELGGSSANNLQDALYLYGLVPGSANLFAATYTIFGNVVKQQYPRLVPSFPPADQILNTSYTTNIAARSGGQVAGKADTPVFSQSPMKEKVSTRSWAINFATGSATFTPDSTTQLEELKNGLLVADDLVISLEGHTDNTGDPGNNITLSQARAGAVETWLTKQSPSSFPRDRFVSVKGLGDTHPVASNDSETGRAKNRRVVVTLGTN
jgi:outer membrane protein OmpA-like peptidoglycan-associated protein